MEFQQPATFKFENDKHANPKDKGPNRVSVACERCRKRHKKCNGGNPCDNCAKSRAECTYIESERKIVVTLKYIQNLQNENAALKSEMENLKTSSANSSKRIKMEDEEEDVITKRARMLKASESQSPKSFAIDSDTNFQARAPDRELVRKDSLIAGSTSLTDFGDEINKVFPTANISFKELDDQSQLLSASNTTLIKRNDQFFIEMRQSGHAVMSVELNLPPYEVAICYFDAFNIFLGECFYFINPGRFRYELYNLYYGMANETPLSRDNVLIITSILMIMAIGNMYHAGKSSADHSTSFPGIEYFNKATLVVNFAFTSLQSGICSVVNVQALLLYAFYHQIVDSTSGHFLMCGLAMRSALVVGLYNDTNKTQLNRYELEHRRRIWWTLYAVDRYCSAKFGFPLSIPDEVITTELPTEIPAAVLKDNTTRYDEFPDALYIVHFIKISQIFSSMMARLYQKKINSDIVPIIMSVLSEAYEWRKNLPNLLKVDYTQENIKMSRTIVNIHSEYFRCINLTIRPLLLYFVRKRLRSIKVKRSPIDLSRYPKDIVILLNASLQASIQTIRSHNYLLDLSLLAKFGYLDREYIYSAISTLLLFNVSFGVHTSASQYVDVGLSLLSEMAKVGNKNALRRKEQSLHLIATFERNGIPAHYFPSESKYSTSNQVNQFQHLSSTNAPGLSERLPSISHQGFGSITANTESNSRNILPPPRPSESGDTYFGKKQELQSSNKDSSFPQRSDSVSLPSISRMQQQAPPPAPQYENFHLPPPSPKTRAQSPRTDNFNNYSITKATKGVEIPPVNYGTPSTTVTGTSLPQESATQSREFSPSSDITSGSANTPERYAQNFALLNQSGPDMFENDQMNLNNIFRHTSDSLGLPINFFNNDVQENMINPDNLESYSTEFLDLLNGTSSSVNGGVFQSGFPPMPVYNQPGSMASGMPSQPQAAQNLGTVVNDNQNIWQSAQPSQLPIYWAAHPPDPSHSKMPN